MTSRERGANGKRWWWIAALAVLIVGGLALLIFYGVDFKQIQQQISLLPALPVFLFMAISPVFGFSIAATYLIAGAKFGSVWGLVYIGLATVVHLLGSHWLGTSFLCKPLEKFLRKRKYHMPDLPQDAKYSISFMTAIIPGPPYFARNYLLAVSGIPLRNYFWVCWPIYVLRSSLTILVGDMSREFTLQKVLLFSGILLVKIVICFFIVKRIRARHPKAFSVKEKELEPESPVTKAM